MATNLRTLLGKKVLRDYGSASDYQNGAGQMTGGPYRWENSGISGTGNGEGNLLPMFPLEGYNTLVFVATGGNWVTPDEHPGSGPDAKHNTYYPDWEVPAGATDLIFELWGGGGAGGGNCCCHSGPPGGSGAYAYKRLMGDEVVPGCKYQLCVAPLSQRSSSCSGRRGCKTFVVGHNIPTVANDGYAFCAEGGHGGNGSYCYGCCSDGKNVWARYKCVDSNNNPECQMGCCALYYGADYGAHGLPGWYLPRRTDNRCCNHWGVPYPGGLVNSRGGWIEVGQVCEARNCAYCEQNRALKQVGFGGAYCFGYVPGMGGSTAYNCENSVYCGTAGYPGMIRVHWK